MAIADIWRRDIRRLRYIPVLRRRTLDVSIIMSPVPIYGINDDQIYAVLISLIPCNSFTVSLIIGSLMQ